MGPPISFRATLHSIKTVTKLRIAVQARHFNRDAQTAQQAFKAIVVGAGPAGIAAVGTLLDNGIAPVKWIDNSFNGGRLNERYRLVPSNTKVKLFLSFADAVTPFRKIVQSAADSQPNAYTTLQAMDQEKGCQIKYAADLCLQLTEGLKHNPQVSMLQGDVQSASQDKSGQWHVTTSPSLFPTSSSPSPPISPAPLLVLSTGSSPNTPTLPARYPHLTPIDLDLALNPPLLAATLHPNTPQTIALIGASHSAILVLRNLCNLASSTHPSLRIKWFSRHPLRYAVDKGDWILRDNTGLKGETAIWAKENLEDNGVFERSDVANYVEKIWTGSPKDENAVYGEQLPACQAVVEATGYTRDAAPRIEVRGREVQELVCDHVTGGFVDGWEKGRRIKGLFGVGIAFPERVTDPEGNMEMAVGLWKFMRYLKRVVPGWKKEVEG